MHPEEFMPKQKRDKWIGFDLGGTKMLAAVFDSNFDSLGRERKRTKGRDGAEAGMKRIIDTINDALEDAEVEPSEVAGIGIGCPGPLDLERGVMIDAPNLGWQETPVADILKKEFRCDAFLMNDVDAGIFGEYRFGAGKQARCVLGVFPGTGIGGGCVYDGRILRGRRHSCMEIGHVQVLPNGPLCGCGRRGCLETVGSRLAIAANAAKAAFRGEAPYLLENTGLSLSEIRSRALANSVKHGDIAVKQIIENAAHYIGVAVGNMINLMAPDIIVLGGGLVEAMPDLLTSQVAKSATATAMTAYAESFEVVAAALGDDAAIMGAAAWAETVSSGSKAD